MPVEAARQPAGTAAVSAPVREVAGPAASARKAPRGRRASKLALLIVCAFIAGGAAAGAARLFRASPAAPLSSQDATSLATVTRQSLSSQTTVNGTLGYAGSFTAVIPAAPAAGSAPGSQGQAVGTFTALPIVGQVVRQGQSAYSVSGSPVILLYGPVPAYRSLAQSMSGTDVQQLNSDLVALGDATRSELDPGSSYFGAATAVALGKLQSSLGLPETGNLPLGQAVFAPTAIKVSGVNATLGAPVQPGAVVLQATSTARQVTAQVDATQEPEVTPGAQVSVVLPGGGTTPGVVTSVGTVASVPSGSGNGSGSGSSGDSGSSPSSDTSGSSDTGAATVNVGIRLGDPAATGTLDQAPVQVSITTATVNDALAVPVDALLAQPGGYAVEVAGARGSRHLVSVSLGLFDDAAGLVQVSGRGLARGQQVVVPQI